MNTQNTPVHIRLWHKDFWLMAVACMLITMTMYIQFPLLHEWLTNNLNLPPLQVALVMGIPGIGAFSLGILCSYLVQKYRRNIVCIKAICAMGLCLFAMTYIFSEVRVAEDVFVLLLIIRFLMGAFFGLAQMILSSTLIIDTCESFQRTEANHSAAWFARFALSVGPAVAIALLPFTGVNTVIIIGLCLCAVAILFILMVKFPFRTPEDAVKKISLDRFFLPQGVRLFVNFTIVTIVIGLLLSSEHTLIFYCMLMVGFFFSLLAQRFVFVNAELKSEVITGLLLVLVGLLMRLSRNYDAATYFYPVLLGCGMGIIASRFLLFFIKLSHHCQRGTSQSTYFLSWETGIYLGVFFGYCFFYGNERAVIILSIILSCIALLMYLFLTHKWYINNKNR